MKIAVIGGGPAGMIAAARAAERGHQVELFEKNNKLGKKLYITGKGRANVTNLTDRESFLANVVRNPKFLMSAYNAFDSQCAYEYYEKLGVPLKVERGDRVFPQSDKSNDIIKAHIKDLERAGVKISLETSVRKLICINKKIKGLELVNDVFIEFDAVIIATGGKSYPMTGSTGEGYKLAQECGHNIIEPKAALVPIILSESLDMEGLSLKNVKASILNKNGKILFSEFGEMLFTSNGVSGPIILTLSSKINRLNEQLYLSIDLKPALSIEQLDLRVIRDFSDAINKDFVNSLDDLLPKSIIPEVIMRSDIDPRIKVNQVDKASRLRLVRIIKDFRFKIDRLDGIDNAIITSGGIDVKEINPKTMQSRLIDGLHFAGEVIDVDALTGGFNIQIALSTGYVAGISIG